MHASAVAALALAAVTPVVRAEPAGGPSDLLAAGLHGDYSHEARLYFVRISMGLQS